MSTAAELVEEQPGWLAAGAAQATLPLRLLAIGRLIAIFTVTLCLAGLFLAFRSVRLNRPASLVYRGWARAVCRICGLRLVIRGKADRAPGCLYVANHCSYLDIPVLRAVLDATFVSRHDVAGWPLLGPLARMTGTLFFERRARRSGEQARQVAGQLERGTSVILFPEGTSTDGNRVLPFKSSLFAAVERADCGMRRVQPVTVAYTRIYNVPMSLIDRPRFAWYGDMDLAPHLWELLHIGSATVEVTLHDTMAMAESGDRKQLANRCREIVADGLHRSLSGRQG